METKRLADKNRLELEALKHSLSQQNSETKTLNLARKLEQDQIAQSERELEKVVEAFERQIKTERDLHYYFKE